GVRDGGYARVALLAEHEGQAVGHVLFSDLSIVGATGTVPALALAPLAVVPEHQKRGIGSALLRRGLEACRAQGHRVILVVGHPDYYPRFGFSADLAARLQSPYGRRPSVTALGLRPGALAG